MEMDKTADIVKKHKNGATINLYITPGSKKTIFPSGFNEWRKCVEMNVCSPAQDNKANMEVLKTIAGFFEKPFSNVLLVSGAKKREKKVLIKKCNISEIGKKLEASLDGL
jgi:uncharacterized protein (TIGR00251 family)